MLDDIIEMTKRRFKLARHFRDTRDWDFLMLVEMGTDRLHHCFWRFYDKNHPDYVPGNQYEQAFRDYYKMVDAEMGRLIEGLGDDTAMWCLRPRRAVDVRRHPDQRVADAKRLPDAWSTRPPSPTPIGRCQIDWSRTKVWARRRLLLAHLPERAPAASRRASCSPAEVEALRDELIAKLEALGDEQGQRIGTRVYRPSDLYRVANDVPPDLIAYFGNLTWRSIGSVGDGRIHVRENDTGPDDANHAKNGMAIMAGPGMPRSLPADASLYDIAPTVLAASGPARTRRHAGPRLLTPTSTATTGPAGSVGGDRGGSWP